MILLDTHVLLWWIDGRQKLPTPVLKEIESHKKKQTLALSAITFWEIAMLSKKGRLSLKTDLKQWISQVLHLSFLQIISPDHSILVQSVLLPEPFHSDPADRILVATAQQHAATLITKDQKILAYTHVDTFWQES